METKGPPTGLDTAPGFAPGAAARTFGCGLAMGVADAVPGVSGGTIALILGIYERFIAALARVVAIVRHPVDRGTWALARRAMVFLAPLGAGAVIALWSGTKLLVGELPRLPGAGAAEIRAHLAASPPSGWLVNPETAPLVFAFFFGLVLLSVGEPWRTKKSTRAVDWLLVLVGAAAAATLSLAPPGAGSTAPLALAAAGAVAVSVMLLPGVSGSLALLVLGMYQPVSSAVHEREFVVLGWFLAGMAVGVATFVPLLRWLLARVHDRTMSLLSGLMAGSLVALWPWKQHYLPKFIGELGPMSPLPPPAEWWGPVLAAIGGATLIVVSSAAVRRAGRGGELT